MLSKQTIAYVHLSEDSVRKANKLNLSDKTVTSHFKSTKSERWKMSTEEWIDKMYKKRFKADH